jgi:hypothetical protein|tara:strand:+ start:1209 stop:1415 length:207 start_codon:yes stop_codon:yes gene_type:complete
MAKKKINELSLVSKFVDAFFDGMQQNTSNRFIAKAKKRGLPKKVTDKLAKIKKEKDELASLLRDIDKL